MLLYFTYNGRCNIDEKKNTFWAPIYPHVFSHIGGLIRATVVRHRTHAKIGSHITPPIHDRQANDYISNEFA